MTPLPIAATCQADAPFKRTTTAVIKRKHATPKTRFYSTLLKPSYMERLQLKTIIAAPKEKVWRILWDEQTYKQWTRPFCEGSYAKSDWKEGSKVLFLSPNNEGLSSVIERKIENQFMSFSHKGVVKGGIEDFSPEATKDWAGAIENYTLSENDGLTELIVDIDITPEHKDFFLTTWPQAFSVLKELAEERKVD